MSESLKIALIGQAAFGEKVLHALVEKGEQIVAVVCPPDRDGAPADPIKVAAETHGIAVHQFGRMRDDAAIEAFRAIGVDLGVMAFVTDIVPEEILQAPTLGTIHYHPSLLPKHRGPSSINWPIIQGETKTGLSIFWPDAGLDTGPILLQKEVTIEANDTLGTVYFDKLFPIGVEAMVESVGMVRAETAPKLEQDESQATYEGWCRAKDCIVDWTKSVATVHDLIRGADPSPGAGTIHGGSALQLYGATRSDEDPGQAPGTLLELNDDGIRVAAAGGSVLIARVKPEGSKKVAASEWAASKDIKSGAVFGA